MPISRADFEAAWEAGSSARIRRELHRLLTLWDRAAGRSYWHPLGFFRIELFSNAHGARFGIHVWPRGGGRPQQPLLPIHRHVWDFQSYVISGRQTNHEVDIADHGRPGFQSGVLFKVESHPEHSTLQLVNPEIFWRARPASSIPAGEIYSVSPNQFHYNDVDYASNLYTLVKMGARVNANSLVIGESPDQDGMRYERIPVARSLVTDHLQDVIALLET